MGSGEMRIKDIPLLERPRERLISKGASALSDSELLAAVIRTGSSGENALQLSQRLLKKGLKKLSRMKTSQLTEFSGVGVAKACQLEACFELAKRAAENKTPAAKISTPKDAVNASNELAECEKETFQVLCLDSKKRLVGKEVISVGSSNASVVHPREVFKAVLSGNSAGFILLHNHPSGNPEPSEEDLAVTRRLKKASEVVGVVLLDHVIIGGKKYFSMKENGLL